MVAWVEETRGLLEGLQNTLEADPVAGRGCLRNHPQNLWEARG
jgi:hypothetical protein